MQKLLFTLATILLLQSTSIMAVDEMAGLTYWNKLQQEAVTTESGLQYKVLIEGDGRKPGPKSHVLVHYRGLLLNGMQFDSSWDSDEPVRFGLKRVIKGWTEGIQLMPEGSVYVFLIPPELAYGSRGSGVIPPDATLIFEVELFEVK